MKPMKPRPADWPTCVEQGCQKPCKMNHNGGPRQRCSACDKRREAKTNAHKPCAVPGCTRTRTQARRYCGGHVNRLSRYGDLFADVPMGELRDYFKEQNSA